MADKRFTLINKSYPAERGGMVHKGAQGTADDFEKWLGKEVYDKALKAKNFQAMKSVKEPVETDAKKGAKKGAKKVSDDGSEK